MGPVFESLASSETGMEWGLSLSVKYVVGGCPDWFDDIPFRESSRTHMCKKWQGYKEIA